MDSLYLLIGAVGGLIAGGVAVWLIIKSMARSRAKTIVEEAQLEADMLKKNKLLEIKEEEMKMKAEVERQSNARMQKIQAHIVSFGRKVSTMISNKKFEKISKAYR